MASNIDILLDKSGGLLNGGATAPTFSVGYDNDLRGVVRNVLTAFGSSHFGFLNVTI